MAMEPWYNVATPRAEVREGRSFNPEKFAMQLKHVVFKSPSQPGRIIVSGGARNAD